jgi:hypothetical protein
MPRAGMSAFGGKADIDQIANSGTDGTRGGGAKFLWDALEMRADLGFCQTARR